MIIAIIKSKAKFVYFDDDDLDAKVINSSSSPDERIVFIITLVLSTRSRA